MGFRFACKRIQEQMMGLVLEQERCVTKTKQVVDRNTRQLQEMEAQCVRMEAKYARLQEEQEKLRRLSEEVLDFPDGTSVRVCDVLSFSERVARDGCRYKLSEFLDYYGSQRGWMEWSISGDAHNATETNMRKR